MIQREGRGVERERVTSQGKSAKWVLLCKCAKGICLCANAESSDEKGFCHRMYVHRSFLLM